MNGNDGKARDVSGPVVVVVDEARAAAPDVLVVREPEAREQALERAIARHRMSDLERRLAEIEEIKDPHRRRTERARLMKRVGRWVVRHPAQEPLAPASIELTSDPSRLRRGGR